MRHFLVASLLVWLLSSCGGPSPGTPEAAFDAAVVAVEDGDIDRLEGMMAPDFSGDSDRTATIAYARQWLGRKPHPKVSITVLKQEKKENHSGVTFRSQLLVSSGGGLIPERSSRVQVDTQWEFIQGQWKVRVVQWNKLR